MRSCRDAALHGGWKERSNMDNLHLWNGGGTADTAKQWTEMHLAASREKVAELLAVEGTRTVANTLALFDKAQWHLRMAGSQTGVMFMVHPAAEVRDAAQELSQTVSAAGVALSLNQAVYRALEAVDASAEDAATRYYQERTLLSYRLSGVDRDEATREKVRALSERMTELSMSFSRTVQDDVRKIAVDDPNELLGLPADYLARHGVREEGAGLKADAPVVLTTDPPEMSPVMNYAVNPALRRKMYLAYNDRGYPSNKQILLDLLAVREEMAELLGFRSWADLATVDQMMGSAANMRQFLEEVEDAARETAQHEFAALEAFVRERNPEALPLTLSDARFWEEQYRRAHYDFDSQSVRPYFPYEQVEAGILATAGKLFRVRFEQVSNAPVWDTAVKAFDVLDDDNSSAHKGETVGRIYLDMHPREGKSKWFSECSLVGGVLGEQVPEASLVCNFPQPKKDHKNPEKKDHGNPEKDDPGLLQYSDVVTYFHEFGHLMHAILGGQTEWAGLSGFATEGDFIEVPSQMLEEFFRDEKLLQAFAKHFETGQVLPAELIRTMKLAGAFGRADWVRTQLYYTTLSLNLHDEDPAKIDPDSLTRELYKQFQPWTWLEGNRMYASFGHLMGYSSNYYTYMFDKVIALDFFGQFDAEDLLGCEAGTRYRKAVLEQGGSKPGREMVRDFLGRDEEFAAFSKWLNEEFEETGTLGPSHPSEQKSLARGPGRDQGNEKAAT